MTVEVCLLRAGTTRAALLDIVWLIINRKRRIAKVVSEASNGEMTSGGDTQLERGNEAAPVDVAAAEVRKKTRRMTKHRKIHVCKLIRSLSADCVEVGNKPFAYTDKCLHRALCCLFYCLGPLSPS